MKRKKDEAYDFLTNLEKIYWPKEKITKEVVLGYYAEISDIILPHLIDRPQSLKRFPEGIYGETFFQKNVETAPSWITTVPIEHHDGKRVNYVLIKDRKSLLYVVNMGCIELHPWLSRYQTLEYPDFIIFDLDPEAISFDAVIETALALHETLDSIGAPNFCKTTGATGIHVYVPLGARYTYDQGKQFAVLIATHVHQKLSSITSLERSPKKRQKKVYIDCFQNNFGQTVVAPYALRAKPGVPVATPLEWSEVKPGIKPLDFNLFNILPRLQKKKDVFKDVLGKGIDMKKALQKFEKLTDREKPY